MSQTVPLSRPLIGADEESAVLRVLRSGRLTQGPEVAAFEVEFSAAVGGRLAIAVSSGTAALHLLLLAHGIGSGDEVIVPSFTFAASANAVRLTGAEVVFVDIEPRSFCLDPDAVRSALTARTAAILAVHLYGHPSDMTALATLARSKGVLLLEDAAQAHAASLDGVPVGALGDGAAFSFYPSKNMTTGEGGMVSVRDGAVADRVRLLRNQGMAEQYEHKIVGFNLRLTDLQAAIGRVQLAALGERTASATTPRGRVRRQSHWGGDTGRAAGCLPRVPPVHRAVGGSRRIAAPPDYVRGRVAPLLPGSRTPSRSVRIGS